MFLCLTVSDLTGLFVIHGQVLSDQCFRKVWAFQEPAKGHKAVLHARLVPSSVFLEESTTV